MLKKFFERLEKIEVSPLAALLSVSAVGILRYALEKTFFPHSESWEINPITVLDFVTFYVFIFLSCMVGQKLFLNRISYGPILFGFLLALAPPIIDGLLLNQKANYVYLEPSAFFFVEGMPLGELFATYASIFLYALYVSISRGDLRFIFPALAFGWFIAQVGSDANIGGLVGLLYALIGQAAPPERIFRPLSPFFVPFFFASRSIAMLAAMLYLDSNFRKSARWRILPIFLFAAISLAAI